LIRQSDISKLTYVNYTPQKIENYLGTPMYVNYECMLYILVDAKSYHKSEVVPAVVQRTYAQAELMSYVFSLTKLILLC
jgi:hypothetical protein